MDFERFLARCRNDRDYAGQICADRLVEAREARFGELSAPLPEPLAAVLRAAGIERLYVHQCEAIEAARRGEHLVLCTGTASGKTLAYNLPALEHWLADRDARALYLFPTKALAQDQLRGLLRFREGHPALDFEAGCYDGDTPASQRTWLRDRGHFILTNPDMLHSGILPNHARWGSFFAKLRFVVIDEIHSYRGVFGSNVANVLLRLRRICEHHQAQVQFICCSATIANPGEHASDLLDAPVRVIDDDGSPRGPRRFVLWNPRLVDGRRSPNVEAKELMCALVRKEVQTICFTRARVVAELLYRYVHDSLSQSGSRLAQRVRAYRGGYLAEERREIERQLFEGELLGVMSTNALELGIDIGGLDACLIVGYPGSIASVWQQAGRAGRGAEQALVIWIADDTPRDQYLVQHPEYFFGQSPEHAIIDRQNHHILLGHLRCALMELPVRSAELARFGEYAPALLDLLVEHGLAARRGDAWHWTGRGYPAADISLRTVSDDTYNIIDVAEHQVIGTIDAVSAFTLVHDEAIYMHHGETWFVEKLDLVEKSAYVRRIDADYYTNAVTDTAIRVDVTEEEARWRECQIGFGDVTVTIFTLMFKKIKFYSQDSLGYGSVDLPPQPLETGAMWLIPPAAALHLVREHGRIPAEGMLGIANVLVDIVPLYVLCDYADCFSVVDDDNFGAPTIFIYDRYPGGLGFARKAYELLESILEACVYLIHHCPCERGCPSCVGSTARSFVRYDADGRLREQIPDKEAALVILHHLLGLEPYIPRPLAADERARLAGQEPPAEAPIKRLPEHVERRLRRQLRGRRER